MSSSRSPAGDTTASGRDASEPIDTGLDAVTGGFSYSGRWIAQALIEAGRSVRTLTGHPARAGNDSPLEVAPLSFENPPALVEALRGVTTLYNTYWVRFAAGGIDHDQAVTNSRTLFHAARLAGVQRIVHVSITNPGIDSPYPYFRGKALVERALAETGVPYAVLRPGILFGGNGVLLNNVAWLLRHLPAFAIGGRGDYRIRPIHVRDLARLALEAGRDRNDSIVNAVGPEQPTFLEMVEMVRVAVGSRARLVHVPGIAIPPLTRIAGMFLHDVLLTRDEYRAMVDGLADVDGPATGATALSTWTTDHAEELGLRYANELELHYR